MQSGTQFFAKKCVNSFEKYTLNLILTASEKESLTSLRATDFGYLFLCFKSLKNAHPDFMNHRGESSVRWLVSQSGRIPLKKLLNILNQLTRYGLLNLTIFQKICEMMNSLNQEAESSFLDILNQLLEQKNYVATESTFGQSALVDTLLSLKGKNDILPILSAIVMSGTKSWGVSSYVRKNFAQLAAIDNLDSLKSILDIILILGKAGAASQIFNDNTILPYFTLQQDSTVLRSPAELHLYSQALSILGQHGLLDDYDNNIDEIQRLEIEPLSLFVVMIRMMSNGAVSQHTLNQALPAIKEESLQHISIMTLYAQSLQFFSL